MECDQIREMIPRYIVHTTSEDEVGAIEEHLCVCNSCRQFLSRHIDKSAKPQVPEDGTVSRRRIGSWEYAVLFIGILILIFFLRLLLKG
ncbi:MAG: zf-HC2 domain-containing protein [Candidatus Omnitrophota bacterium]|nr:MAG: zf-HC2 domain-containing protein [Candidatus Omnitrophota bacterium]